MEISQLNGNTLVDATFYEYVHTVGAVIFSFNDSFSPSALWGGSWSRVTNRFLIGSGGTYSTGVTGGEANVTLTTDEIPSHSHPLVNANSNFNPSYGFGYLASVDGGDKRQIYNPTANTGGGQAHNNMPPYIGCNIWRKIA